MEEPAHEHGAQHSGVGYSRPWWCPGRTTCAGRRRCSTPGARWPCWWGRGVGGDRRGDRRRRAPGGGRGQGPPGEGGRPGRSALRHRQRRVAGDGGELQRHAAAVRHPADGRPGFPYTEFLPAPGQARGVQIDIAGRMLSLRYPMEVGLVGDSAETLRALLPLLQAKADLPVGGAGGRVVAHGGGAGPAAGEPAQPPAPLPRALAPPARWLHRRRGQRFLHGVVRPAPQAAPGDAGLALRHPGHMGSAIPLAARRSTPTRTEVVIATAGDGAMQMNGINALIDVAWPAALERSAPDRAGAEQPGAELRHLGAAVMEGEPKFPASQDIPDFLVRPHAELLGLRACGWARRRSRGPGTRPWPPTARCWSRRWST